LDYLNAPYANDGDNTWSLSIADAIQNSDLQRARSLAFHWLQCYQKQISLTPNRQTLRQPHLWSCLADVVERTSDQYLLEYFWQILDGVNPDGSGNAADMSAAIPLVGIPILNRPDLLENLLNSIDHPVQTVAIVDNSGGDPDMQAHLDRLQARTFPLIGRLLISRNFSNLGVAASWNQILLGFPQASFALLVNNDIEFSKGTLRRAQKHIDSSHPQFLSLMPEPHTYSAFFITAKTWDCIGLFDNTFYPAYCEDLDYRDRIRADPGVQILDGSPFFASMLELNPGSSQTIASDPTLARFNRASFALNRLWYLSHRRLRNDPRGTWIRRWLAAWQD
jgi:hypothetical protein